MQCKSIRAFVSRSISINNKSVAIFILFDQKLIKWRVNFKISFPKYCRRYNQNKNDERSPCARVMTLLTIKQYYTELIQSSNTTNCNMILIISAYPWPRLLAVKSRKLRCKKDNVPFAKHSITMGFKTVGHLQTTQT